MIEFAIVAPFLSLILFGMLEFGMAWRDSLTVSSATRAGVRVASSWGNEREADYQALLGLIAALESIDVGDIEGVLVYDGGVNADGSAPATCLSGGPHAVAGMCNYYTGAQLASLGLASFGGTTSCDPSAWDWHWCPLDRSDDQGAGLDYVGMRLVIDHDLVTGVFPRAAITLTEDAVMRVEPR